MNLVERYPFLSKARELVGGDKVGVDELDEAKRAVLAVLSQKESSSVPSTALEAARLHALQRLLLFALDNEFVSSRYAFAVSREFAESLKEESEGDFYAVAKDFFPSLEKGGEENYWVSLGDYLSNGGAHLESEDVDGGSVRFDRAGLTALLREALVRRLKDFTGLNKRALPKLVKSVAKELSAELPRESAPRLFKGRNASMPCVKGLVEEGALEGKRYYGAMSVAVAFVNDGVPRGEAEAVMRDYVSKCEQGNEPYSLHEALSVLDWVYKHPGIRFSCQTFRDQFGDAACAKCGRRKK
ncbi:hypothetical protein AUJ15_01245 [Candidatus Micrarchaeota archaeon CG1_02_55_41]|nr:MAG: hypothetical protein AUJ15_01245 [Candidatus Micrarchaeota archaeon CG1_02_55_41]